MSDFFQPTSAFNDLPEITQQQLHELLNTCEEYGGYDNAPEDVGIKIVVYVMQEFARQKIESYTDEMVQEAVTKLVFNHALDSLVNKGLVDVYTDENGEFLYAAKKCKVCGEKILNCTCKMCDDGLE